MWAQAHPARANQSQPGPSRAGQANRSQQIIPKAHPDGGSRKPEAMVRNQSNPEPTRGNWSPAEQWQLPAALVNPWKRCPEAIQSSQGRDRQSRGMAFQDSFLLGFQPGSVGSSGEFDPQNPQYPIPAPLRCWKRSLIPKKNFHGSPSFIIPQKRNN